MLIGHQRILDFFKKSIAHQRLAHAYLFVGPAHLGKKALALEFIKLLTGQEINQKIHPDISIIEPNILEKDDETKKESVISIKQIRDLQHQLSLSPYRAEYKIALIDRAEKMNREAANSFLKTLEEPTGRVILILITANPQMVLPTIVSRCQIVKFLPVPEEEIIKELRFFKNNPNFERVVKLASGRPGLALQYLENPTLLEEENKISSQLEKLLRADFNERFQYAEVLAKDTVIAQQTISQWLIWFRDLLLVGLNCPGLMIDQRLIKYQNVYSLNKLKNIIQAIKKTNQLLANPSFNSRLALEVLMLEI